MIVSDLLDKCDEPNPHSEVDWGYVGKEKEMSEKHECNCGGKCGDNCKCKNKTKDSCGYDIYIGSEISSVYMNGMLVYQCCCREEESVRYLFEKFKQTAEFKLTMDEISEDWNAYVNA